MGDPRTKSYQMGVHGLICVNSGVLELKKFRTTVLFELFPVHYVHLEV